MVTRYLLLLIFLGHELVDSKLRTCQRQDVSLLVRNRDIRPIEAVAVNPLPRASYDSPELKGQLGFVFCPLVCFPEKSLMQMRSPLNPFETPWGEEDTHVRI